ncbi:MAG TPA: hypothetical protein PLT03_01640 [Bacillota bacterium]|nr:hypothetical protein [Bacillota bacterium]HOA14785.1 hypothetical protein [Bacillota bacterium]HOG52556.1 hypothetical protein [Bacillota bacterium]
MSALSLVLFILGAFYAAGLLFNFPIFFDKNPKTRFIISKIGLFPYKVLLGVIALACIVGAVLLR